MKYLALLLTLLFSTSAFGQLSVTVPAVSSGVNTHNSAYVAAGVGIFGITSKGAHIIRVEYELGMIHTGFSLTAINVGPLNATPDTRLLVPAYAKISRYDDGSSAYSVGVYGTIAVGAGIQHAANSWDKKKVRKTGLFGEISLNWFF